MNNNITNVFNKVFFIEEYKVIVIFAICGLLLSILLFVLPILLVFHFKEEEKMSSYECGFQPFEDTRHRFDVKYYLVAILFILFDMEIMFLVPWTQFSENLDSFNFLMMVVFLSILTIGFIYEWSKGALRWN